MRDATSVSFRQPFLPACIVGLVYHNLKVVVVRQFNEIHNFASSFIFCTKVFCTGVLQYAFCLSINKHQFKQVS